MGFQRPYLFRALLLAVLVIFVIVMEVCLNTSSYLVRPSFLQNIFPLSSTQKSEPTLRLSPQQEPLLQVSTSDGETLGPPNSTNLDASPPMEGQRVPVAAIKRWGNRVILWPSDPNCSRVDVQFGSEWPRTWLLSYPRSGNTWTRYLLQAATGLYADAIGGAPMVAKTGVFAKQSACRPGTTIVTKTHSPKDVNPGDTVIMIIRNPSRSCISLFNYHSSKSRNLSRFLDSVPEKEFDTPRFHRSVGSCIKNWKSVALSGLSFKRLLPIYYEYLREDPITHIRLLLRFLGLEPDEGRLVCLASHLEGKFKGNQLTLDPYTPEEKQLFADAIALVDKGFREKGFQPLPDYSLFRN